MGIRIRIRIGIGIGVGTDENVARSFAARSGRGGGLVTVELVVVTGCTVLEFFNLSLSFLEISALSK